MTLNERLSSTGDAFECQVAHLLAALGLYEPYHLEVGSDRGKDIVCRTTLEGGGNRIFVFHIECKDYSQRKVNLSNLKTNTLWAHAARPDFLVIATTGRFTASLSDWVEQTQNIRSYVIVMWDGKYIDYLNDLIQRQDKSAAKNIQRDLLSKWKAHRTLLQTHLPSLSLRQRTKFKENASVAFVNRTVELSAFSNIGSYAIGCVFGPKGVGKTHLISQLLNLNKLKGLIPILIDLSAENIDPVSCLVENITSNGTSMQSKRLRHHLESYGWENPLLIKELTEGALNNERWFIFLDNIDMIAHDTTLRRFVNDIASYSGQNKVVMTAENLTVLASLVRSPELIFELDGLDEKAVLDYVDLKGLSNVEGLADVLNNVFHGWPMTVAMVCRQPKKTILNLISGIKEKNIKDEYELDDFMKPIIESLLSDISKSERHILEFLAIAPLELKTEDLSTMIGCPPITVKKSILSLYKRGLLLRNSLPLGEDGLHKIIRISVIENNNSLNDSYLILAGYLADFSGSSDRLVGAIKCFIHGEMPHQGCEVMVRHAEQLIRQGKAPTLIRIIQSLENTSTDMHLSNRLALVEARILENLGKFYEAHSILEVQFPQSLREHLNPYLFLCVEHQLARASYFEGNFTETLLHVRNSLKILRRDLPGLSLDDRINFDALARQSWGRVLYAQRKFSIAKNVYKKALALHAEAGDILGVNKVEHRLAMIEIKQRNFETARQRFEIIQKRSAKLGDKKREAYSYHRLGEIARLTGDFDMARNHHLSSLEIKTQIGHRRGMVYSYHELGKIYLSLGNKFKGKKYLTKALTLCEEMDLKKEEASICATMGRLEQIAGETLEAQSWIMRSSQIYRTLKLSSRAEAVENGELFIE